MLPIHANKMDRTSFAVVFEQGAACGQKANELVSAEFTGTLGEFAVPDLSLAGNVAIDRDVIRRVHKDDVSALVLHQPLESGLGRCIAAMEAMAVELPDVISLANRHSRR